MVIKAMAGGGSLIDISKQLPEIDTPQDVEQRIKEAKPDLEYLYLHGQLPREKDPRGL